MIADEATRAQIAAADPRRSTWLSANAGSGKTRVLIDRVARLLLSGVPPQNILCLTYTEAAASEMQNRLFSRLGAWTMLPEGELRRALGDLGEDGGDDGPDLANARRLFARAIETPGGLRIQTIHGFCTGVLRRFPLEAGISPTAQIMEDRAAELLRREVIDDMALDDPASVRAIVDLVSGGDIEGLLKTIVGRSDLLGDPPDRAALAGALGLPPGTTVEDVHASVLTPERLEILRRVETICAGGLSSDVKIATAIGRLGTGGPSDDLEALETVFVYKSGAKAFTAKIGAVPTKKLSQANAELVDELNPIMEAVAEARQRRLAVNTVDATERFLAFARAYLERYDGRKRQRGLLDFDDLIAKTRELLTDRDVSQWVLYRLDGGIDHVLVDESQDTGPAQWAVIKTLIDEMTSGEGARGPGERTVFVVGDLKQSIYSFQGADPAVSDGTRAWLGSALRQSGQALQEMPLLYSFRSAAEILDLVDDTFRPGRQDGLGPVTHRAFQTDMPGRIDLWPPVESIAEDEDDAPWYAPPDQPSAAKPSSRLARIVAAELEAMIGRETIPEHVGGGIYHRRPVRAGDILVLLQTRGTYMAPLIAELKARGLPVAGADRLDLGAELAVKDIGSLLAFLSLPEDDLSLAEALKSPLFGWSEAQLFDLAHGRGKGRYLWAALRDRDGPTVAILKDLRRNADFLRPYDLIQRLLIRHGGRSRLIARLGQEAEDGIDNLLGQALDYEARGVPDLTGFLEWMQTSKVEVKRKLDGRGDQIRVMSVHGAKGLEAPVVVLPDTAKRGPSPSSRVGVVDGAPFWMLNKDQLPDRLADVRQRRQALDEEERRRLLYVAMTRAETWLIVCAAGDVGSGSDSWYGMVADGMDHGPVIEAQTPTGIGKRIERTDWSSLPLVSRSTVEAAPTGPAPDLPPPGPPPGIAVGPVSPSDLDGPKVLPGEADGIGGLDKDAAMAVGTIVHRVLEVIPGLPAAQRVEMARRMIIPDPDGHLIGNPDALAGDLAGLVDRPDLAAIFSDAALVEVPIVGDAPGDVRLSGLIDRLVLEPDRVLAVDYKTNRVVPQAADRVPSGLLAQMGAYDYLLRAVYPDRRVQTALLWTATGGLMLLPQHLVEDAFTAAVARLT